MLTEPTLEVKQPYDDSRILDPVAVHRLSTEEVTGMTRKERAWDVKCSSSRR